MANITCCDSNRGTEPSRRDSTAHGDESGVACGVIRSKLQCMSGSWVSRRASVSTNSVVEANTVLGWDGIIVVSVSVHLIGSCYVLRTSQLWGTPHFWRFGACLTCIIRAELSAEKSSSCLTRSRVSPQGAACGPLPTLGPWSMFIRYSYKCRSPSSPFEPISGRDACICWKLEIWR